MSSTPYIAGNPVSGQGRFIGRADIRGKLSKLLDSTTTNAIVLFGQRRIGKTSLLLQLKDDLMKQKGGYIAVYFDLQNKTALPLPSLLYQLAQHITDVTAGTLPKRRLFDSEGAFFRDIFLPEVVQRVSGKKLLFLFDEFDVLDSPEQAGAAFFPYLSSWISQADAQFIFVLGRRAEELSYNILATMKSSRGIHVSLMKKCETEKIVRQSERNKSLFWQDEGIARVWHCTQGHPYLTQLLCTVIWEAAYQKNPKLPPTVAVVEVDLAIDDTLEQGEHAFDWIWNGLSAAERMVMATIAEANKKFITQNELIDRLNHSGMRCILRELELAPETLAKWDLLRTSNDGFRFAVPLLQKWVADNKSVRRVKAELDHLERLAENLY